VDLQTDTRLVLGENIDWWGDIQCQARGMRRGVYLVSSGCVMNHDNGRIKQILEHPLYATDYI
jgi:hypothetical protein